MINMPRGGFSVRAGGRTVTMKDIERAGKLARKVSKTVKSKGLLKTVKGLAVKGAKAGAAAAVGALADKAWETVNKELNQRLDSKTNGRTLVDAPTEATGPSSPIAAASVVNSKTKMVLANSSDDRVVHKTNYQSGYPLSSAMKRLLKQNGGTYEVIADSKISFRTVQERNVLTQGNGFNQKRYHMPPLASQLTWGQVRNLCFGSTYGDTPNVFADVIKMSAVAKLKQQYLIKNQSVGLPLDMTIHLLKVTDYSLANSVDPDLQNVTGLFARAFINPEEIAILEGRIPRYYMAENFNYSDGVVSQGTRHQNADVLTNTKLNYSGFFKQSFEIVESFRKVIPPGDFWNFSHTHVTGNGIDMKQVSRQVLPPELALGSSQMGQIIYKNEFPFTYAVLFETKGKMGEIYYVPSLGNLDTYLGTTATAWSYEFKTSAYYVTDPTLTDTGIARVPAVIQTVSQSALSPLAGEGASPIRPFNLAFNNIANSQLDEASGASVGRGYIPMTSSAVPSSRLFEGAIPG